MEVDVAVSCLRIEVGGNGAQSKPGLLLLARCGEVSTEDGRGLSLGERGSVRDARGASGVAQCAASEDGGHGYIGRRAMQVEQVV